MFRSNDTAQYVASLLDGRVTFREKLHTRHDNAADRKGNEVINDVFFVILFIVNSLVIACVALTYGLGALASDSPQTIHVHDDGSHMMLHAPKYMVSFVWGMIMLCFVAAALSLGMVYVMSIFAENVIFYSVCMIVGISAFVGIMLITLEISAGGWLMMVFAGISGMFLYIIRPRLRFASINLKIACVAISTMPKIFYYAGLVYGVEIVYCLFWALAVYGLSTNAARDNLNYHGHMYNLDECTSYVYSGSVVINDMSFVCGDAGGVSGQSCKACFCEGSGNSATATLVRHTACHRDNIYIWVYVCMLISILWACSIFSNIIHCTAAGSVAIWWKHGSKYGSTMEWASLSIQDDIPTSSFINAIGTDIGSICYGSLFVALIKGMRNIAMFHINQMNALQQSPTVKRNALGSCVSMLSVYVLKIFEYILLIIDYLLEYFNRYAFTYVAVYGYDFTRASKSVVSLFQDRGWDAIINDDIVDSVMFFCNITVGILTMSIGMLYTRTVIPSISNVDCIIFDMIAFTVGYGLGMVSIKIICAAVACIYVCFAEYPDAFEEAQPALYCELLGAWEQMYPSTTISRHRLDEESSPGCQHSPSKSRSQPSIKLSDCASPTEGDVANAVGGVFRAVSSVGATLIATLANAGRSAEEDEDHLSASTVTSSLSNVGAMVSSMVYRTPVCTEHHPYSHLYVPPVSAVSPQDSPHNEEYDEMTFSL